MTTGGTPYNNTLNGGSGDDLPWGGSIWTHIGAGRVFVVAYAIHLIF